MTMADEKAAKLALESFSDEFLKKKNVTGTGIQEIKPGKIGLAVYVDHKVEIDQLAQHDIIPEDVTVEVDGHEERVEVKVMDVGGRFEAEPL